MHTGVAHTKSIWAKLVFEPRPDLNTYRVLAEAGKILSQVVVWVCCGVTLIARYFLAISTKHEFLAIQWMSYAEEVLRFYLIITELSHITLEVNLAHALKGCNFAA